METVLYSQVLLTKLEITFKPVSFGDLVAILVMIVLLIFSALISGSEVAFFSLSPSIKGKIEKKESKASKIIIKLLKIPERLLATILIANNFINVGIVIISTFITASLFNFSDIPALGFIFQVIIVTFLILLFGEILPKIYASQYPERFSILMSLPLNILEKFFRPVSSFLISSTSMVNKKFVQKKSNISIDDLSEAIDLTSHEIKNEKDILKGIVKFGNIDVKEIMKPRLDVVAIEIRTKLAKVISVINSSGHSRIPIYSENFDSIKGILYIKDLLPHLHKKNTFNWQSLIRPPYFVPETKKISTLLEEFQSNKIHMAFVIDEYGGTSGIITLEDILEEIVGEITDESDEEETIFSKIDENNYLFDGKIPLNDFYKITKSKDAIFNDIKGDADTLAGVILEMSGEIPKLKWKTNYKQFTFIIESVDRRRIKRIKVTIDRNYKS